MGIFLYFLIICAVGFTAGLFIGNDNTTIVDRWLIYGLGFALGAIVFNSSRFM